MALHSELDPAVELSRRELLTLLGAGLALAGTGGCERIPAEYILPYTRNPPELTPGNPVYYATTMLLDGYGTGLLVKSNDGRPTKIEGNPDHPASLGAAGVYEQASVLELYDPARARSIRSGQANMPFEEFALEFCGTSIGRGAGLRFLMEPTSSTLTGALIDRVLLRHPSARFTLVSPVRHGHTEEGARLCFGQRLSPLYDFRQARVILSLDADFLGQPPFHLTYARHFAERRNPDRAVQGTDPAGMVRLYVIEAMPSLTGCMADHRLGRPSRDIGMLAAAIAAELVVGLGARPPGVTDELIASLAPYRTGPDGPWIRAVARDLLEAGPGATVVVGERQPPEVHAVGHFIQSALAKRSVTPGQTAPEGVVGFIEPVLVAPGPAAQDLAALAHDMEDGRVDTLVILGGNPAYTAPADLRFVRALARVPRRIYLGLYEDETAAQSTWFLPAAHMLESWGDARAYDGTESFVQPLIAPFYGGKTVNEVLAVFAGELNPSAYSLLRDHVARRPAAAAAAFEVFFQSALKRGAIAGTQSPRITPSLKPAGIAQVLRALPDRTPSHALEANFLPDPSVYDGRFTQNAWLLELPRPITKLTWGNAAMLSPVTARRLGIQTEDLLELTLNGRTLRAPALIVPDHADDSITLPLGFGRESSAGLAGGVGFNAYPLRSSGAPSFQSGLAVTLLGQRQELARTQGDFTEKGRPIALAATLSQYRENPRMFQVEDRRHLSLMPEIPAAGNQWAMAIDLSICTGCSACVVACQAENNILVVGKEGVMKSREMHWIRIDSYREHAPSGLQIVHQPMLCQHCEMAPCEYVCPVNATVHSPDGLNEMTYNRCVGTRACSNNCPYKVRRFNWFDWIEREPANQGSVMLQRNPQVTVRERGVMEKCTYCVQRIRSAGIQAQIENRPIRNGEVVSACQQTCPTRAIEFGSLAFADSEVVRRRDSPRNYQVLAELGTRPRTTYLAMIKNPHPELT